MQDWIPGSRARSQVYAGCVNLAARTTPRNDQKGTHIFSSFLALPLRILILSSSDSGIVSTHCVPVVLTTNGQSTANRMRSTPISITVQSKAGLEKKPL